MSLTLSNEAARGGNEIVGTLKYKAFPSQNKENKKKKIENECGEDSRLLKTGSFTFDRSYAE